MKKILLLPITTLLLFISCTKNYIDVNDTPNNPLAVPPTTILPNTTIGMAFMNGNDLNRATSAIVQHIAGIANQTAAYDVYNLDGSFDNQWNFEIYSGCINNLQILIDQYAITSPAYSGIARLQMAYVFSVAADLFGDVPYSQAGRGLKFETPRFDKVEDIYQGNPALEITSLFDLVKSGIADLNKPSLLKPGVNVDLVYVKTAADTVAGANLLKWKRFGNSLLLKLALQISNKNPELAKTTISWVLAGNNYINANSLDYEMPFGSAEGNRNPIWDFNNYLRTGDQMLSTRLLNLSRSLNDTVRLSKYFTRPAGAFVAFNNGSTASAPSLGTRSKYNTYLTGSGGEASIKILTFSQVNFILAEAALILGTPGDPAMYYQAGIRSNMQKIGMTDAEIAGYFANNPTIVTLTGTVEDQRRQIITQKYISLIGNGIEAYNDYRRTGYPELILPLNAQGDNPNVVPARLPYPPAELARNPQAPTPRPKTDVKLWWAK